MSLRKLYQTVEDRSNPDFIESHGPFKCKHDRAWLGPGYYFWDTLVDNAHWWGKKAYGERYVVSEYTCDYIPEKCLDLHGDLEQLEKFREIVKLLRDRGLVKEETTVNWIIRYLELDTEFDAIRVSGDYTKANTSTMTLSFVSRGKQVLNMSPAVQICLFRKNSLNLKKGRIIFPTEYVMGYSI